MYTYNLYEWILIFYIYCFLGWIIETLIVSIEEKRIINRGFLKGPMISIYGIGAILVLTLCLPIKSNVALVYVLGMLVATILEYIAGHLMEKILEIKYWDYTDQKLNLHGRICLRSSLFWGVLSVFLVDGVHIPVNNFMLDLNSITLSVITIIISCIFITDFVYSFCTILYFNKIIVYIRNTKEEISNIQSEIEMAKTSTSTKTVNNSL